MPIHKRPDKKLTLTYPDNFELWSVERIGDQEGMTLVCPFKCTIPCGGRLFMHSLQDIVEAHNRDKHATVVEAVMLSNHVDLPQGTVLRSTSSGVFGP